MQRLDAFPGLPVALVGFSTRLSGGGRGQDKSENGNDRPEAHCDESPSEQGCAGGKPRCSQEMVLGRNPIGRSGGYYGSAFPRGSHIDKQRVWLGGGVVNGGQTGRAACRERGCHSV